MWIIDKFCLIYRYISAFYHIYFFTISSKMGKASKQSSLFPWIDSLRICDVEDLLILIDNSGYFKQAALIYLTKASGLSRSFKPINSLTKS